MQPDDVDPKAVFELLALTLFMAASAASGEPNPVAGASHLMTKLQSSPQYKEVFGE